MVIISQSGMSKDTIAVMEKAIANGAMTIAVTNNADSPIAKNADFHLFMDVEEEKSVAATKTYIGELFALYMLTNALRGNFDCALDPLADRISEILYLNPQISDVAKIFINATTLSFSLAELCSAQATNARLNLQNVVIYSTALILLRTLCTVRFLCLTKTRT